MLSLIQSFATSAGAQHFCARLWYTSSAADDVDRYIRLVLTGDGPCYWNAQTVAAAPLRRVRNVYIDKDFAELLLRQALMNKAKSYATHAALAAILPGQTCSLLPATR